MTSGGLTIYIMSKMMEKYYCGISWTTFLDFL